MQLAKSPKAQAAWKLVQSLQQHFVSKLENLAASFGSTVTFDKIKWLRDVGIYGGGFRYAAGDSLFNRASINISQVQYEANPDKSLNSATALSTIIHPDNPLAPSVHMHYSFTELKDSYGYWRLMADLNPSNFNQEDKDKFITCMQTAAGEHFAKGTYQGDKYFNVPALGRTRGVAHFYLENYKTDDFITDLKFTQNFAMSMIDCYGDILGNSLKTNTIYDENHINTQLDYHTLYLFQVLTLDRGTTSGLLIHNQNDVGIMGSLPKFINRKLLKSWMDKVEPPQDKLVKIILDAMPEDSKVLVTEDIKQKLADNLRGFYRQHPDAINLQARGDVVPPTVENHE